MPAAAPHYLVIRRRYLGDIVLLGSVFRNLRLHAPTARITAVIEPAYAGVLALNPDVDSVLPLPASFAQWPGFLRKLRAAGATHVLDFDNTDKTALIARLSGAAHRSTFNRELIPFKYGWAYTHTAEVTNHDYDRQHITETYLRLLGAVDVPVVSREVRLIPRAEDLDHVRKLLPSTLGSRPSTILIHPGSRSSFRLWPAERFAAVIDRCQRELGVSAVLIGSPGETALIEEIRARCTAAPVVVSETLSVPRLAALMSLFPVLLCHDSGPMHLAASVGARVVALYGSQNAVIWRPLGDQHTVLQTSLPCSCLPNLPQPCVKSDSYRSYCVRKLEPADVFAAVAAALK